MLHQFLLCKQPSFLSRECALLAKSPPVVAKRNCLVRKDSERGRINVVGDLSEYRHPSPRLTEFLEN